MDLVTIAIVEDSQKTSDTIKQYLKEYEKENKDINFVIRRFYDTVSFLASYHNDYDLVFMDIELPDGDGLKAIAKVREKDQDVAVIFITHMSQYAVKGYEVRAFDFIVKPVSYKYFLAKLIDVLDHISKNKGRDIWITNKEGKSLIHSKQLMYVEVANHILVFHTTTRILSQSGTLNAVQEMLKGEPFALCNRCYLVNLRFVTGVKQHDVFVGEEKLQISRLKRKEFLTELNNYLAGGD